MTPQPVYSGKVRDIYDAGADHLLFVASDRMSAFDVVMAEPIPDKGRVLTGLSVHWFRELAGTAPSHFVTTDVDRFPDELRALPDLEGRSMLVRKAEMLQVECIVRGYLTGSAWKEYREKGTMHGVPLPAGMRESERLPEPVFTPSTKAEQGHDENITVDEAASIVGPDVIKRAAEISLGLYQRGAALAAERGIIMADTKFELGFIDGELAVCDEVLTPDSSRFWDVATYVVGSTPPSFDKQPLRDWLEARGWDKLPPPPALPNDVVAATRDRYVAAYERITGESFDRWLRVASST